MVKKEGVSLYNHQVDAIADRKAAVKNAMKILYDTYYKDYSKKFFPEESDEVDTRLRAHCFVNTLYSFVLPEIEYSFDGRENVEEEVLLRAATPDFIRQLYEHEIE